MKRAAVLLALAGCATVDRGSETVSIPGTSVHFEMVRIEGRGPIPGFWMGAREVTWGEFDRFYEFAGDQEQDGVTRPSRGKDYLALSGLPNEFMLPERPLTNVRYHAALVYCEWLSKRTGAVYRLPTEAEWDLARGDPSGEQAWTQQNSEGRTHSGGAWPPNRNGVCDLQGNVWEYLLEPESPPDFEPVAKGGAWNTVSMQTRPMDPDWSLADPNRPFSTWWFRAGNSQGIRVVRVGEPSQKAERESYAAKIVVGAMAGVERDVSVGKSVSTYARVTGTVRNAGDRSLDELLLKVYYLDPSKKPHVEDTASSLTRRATFNLAMPVLVSSAHGGPNSKPLAPGESRTFAVDIPISFDADDAVDLEHFGASVWSVRFTP